MVDMPWPLALLVLGLWLGPPLLLICVLTRAGAVRVASATALAVALTLLYAVALELVQGPGLPSRIDALILWGPTTLVACGSAVLADRWRSRRRDPAGARAAAAPGPGPELRRSPGRGLVVAFVVWSALCGGCVFSPAAEFVDLRLDSPTPGLVLPMPKDLTLASADRSCGSVMCAEIYLIGSPDGVGPAELTERLWAHLVRTKGWQRLRDDAGCRRPGWIVRNRFCAFVDVEQMEPVAVLKVQVTGALTVA
jgi:hypothetical protein